MSSYQNVSESEIQGYNDCSLLMSYQSSSSARSRTTKKLSHHNLLNSTTSLDSLNRSEASSQSSLMPPAPGSSFPPATLSPMLKPTSASDSSLNSSSQPLKTDDSWISVSECTRSASSNVDVTSEELLTQFEILKKIPSKLNEREFSHYSNKLTSIITSDKLNHDSKVVLLKYLQNYRKENISKELMAYVMSIDGSSSWGLPLKKILDNIK